MITIKRLSFGAFILLMLFSLVNAWYYQDWNYRIPINISNPSNNSLNEYQIILNISYNSDMNLNFSDLRFSYFNNTGGDETPLYYWIEAKQDGQWAYVWVKVPSIPANGNATIYLYYGNPSASSESNVSNVFIRVIDGLVGSWHFDEGNGTIAHDTSGNGNDGTIYGATWVNGKFGKALSFDGSNDYVDCGSSNVLKPINITLEAWANASYLPAWGGIITNKDDPNHGINLQFGTIQDISTLVSDGNSFLYIKTSWQPSTNVWYHVIATHEDSTNKLYVNGTLEAAGTKSLVYSNTNTEIGSFYTGNSLPFYGIIDEVRIYNRALTQEEVQDLYNNYGYTTLNYPGKVLVRKYSSIEPTASFGTSESKNILYVDDNTGCGGYTPCYQSIQAAIDNATDDSEIIVRDGVYNENITVNKKLYIKAENVGGATILGNLNDVVTIIANNTALNGFVIITGENGIIINSSGNVISNNFIISSMESGIKLYSSNNIIYNNYFNNTNNVVFISTDQNFWNISKTSGLNIIGGPYLGGNYWAKPDGTGYSETCNDSDADGICDSAYTLNADNTDFLPLKVYDPKPFINFVPPTPLNDTTQTDYYIEVNVTATDSNLKNLTIYLYNTSGLVDSISQNASSDTLTVFHNFTSLSDGVYYINATACDQVNHCNSTETRLITVGYNSASSCMNITDSGSYALTQDIVGASGTCINISASNVTFDCRGYSIQGQGTSWINGYGIYIDNKNSVIIRNCDISNFYSGIRGISNDSLITNSSLHNNGYGIYLSYSSNNTLSNLTISNNHYNGIYLYQSSSNNISSSTISNNNYGIYLYQSSSNNISSSTVSNNNDDGIYLYQSSSNNISNVNSSNNQGYGDGLFLWDSNNNIVINSTFYNNYYGIKVYGSSFNTLSHLSILENRNDGVYMRNDYYWHIDSDNNTLSYSIISNNSGNGINLYSSYYNRFFNNTIVNNNKYGIYLDSSSNNILLGNNISNNSYNFGIEGSEISHFYEDIDTSNLVDGKPIYYWTNEKNAPNNCQNAEISGIDNAGFVALVSCKNITVEDLNPTKNSHGVILVNTTNSKVHNITAFNNDYDGIYLFYASNNTIINTTTMNNTYGTSNGGGISLDHSSFNTISHNLVSNNNHHGIYSDSSSNNTLSNLTISNNNNNGIYFRYSSNNTLSSLTLTNNSYGIYLYQSSFNNISSSTISNNNYGIRFTYSSNNNTIINNMIQNNNWYGITLYSSQNNVFYNNYLDNNNNIQCGNYFNLWNTTKTLKTNIVGGPYLGGNYWTNPSRTGFSDLCNDTDGDLICDENYSLNCGVDELPLILPTNTTILYFGSLPSMNLDVGTNKTFNITIGNRGGKDAENVSLNATCPSSITCYFLTNNINITNRTTTQVPLYIEVPASYIYSSFTIHLYANDSYSNASSSSNVQVNQPFYQLKADNDTINVSPGGNVLLNFTLINNGNARSPTNITYSIDACPSSMSCNLLYNETSPLAPGENNTTIVNVTVPLTASSGYLRLTGGDDYRKVSKQVYLEVITGFEWLSYSANVSINTTTLHNLTLVNHDSNPKTLNLSVICPSYWSCSLNQTNITIDANSEANVTLQVYVPFKETDTQKIIFVSASEYSRTKTLSAEFNISQPDLWINVPHQLNFTEGINNYSVNITNIGEAYTIINNISLTFPSQWQCNISYDNIILEPFNSTITNISCYIPHNNTLTQGNISITVDDSARQWHNSSIAYVNTSVLVWLNKSIIIPRNEQYTFNITLINNGTADAKNISIYALTEQYVTASVSPTYISSLPAGNNITVLITVFANYSLDKNYTIISLNANYSDKHSEELMNISVKKPLLIIASLPLTYATPQSHINLTTNISNKGNDNTTNLTIETSCPFGWECNATNISDLNINDTVPFNLSIDIPATAAEGSYDVVVKAYEALEGKEISKTEQSFEIYVYIPSQLNQQLPSLELMNNLSYDYNDIILYDIDKDGVLDLIGANSSGVFMHKGIINDINNVSYLAPTQVINDNACDVAIGDIDKNNLTNIIVIDASSGRLDNWEENGPSFSLVQSKATPFSASHSCSITLLDADNDGYLEAAVWADNSTGNTNIYLFNTSSYGFETFYTIASASHPDLTSVDLDGDGKIDLIAGDNNGQILWWRNKFNGSFVFDFVQGYPNLHINANIYACVAQPFLNDTYSSIITSDSKPELEIFENRNGTLTDKAWDILPSEYSRGIACGDIDKDGGIDIIVLLNDRIAIYTSHLAIRQKAIDTFGSYSQVKITFANPFYKNLSNVVIEDHINASKLSYMHGSAYIIDYDGIKHSMNDSDVIQNSDVIIFKNILSYLPSNKLPLSKDKYLTLVYNVSHLAANPWINIHRAYINYTINKPYTYPTSYLLTDQVNNLNSNPNIINPELSVVKGRDYTNAVINSLDFIASNISVYDASSKVRDLYYADPNRKEITVGKDLAMNASIKNNGSADNVIIEVTFYVNGELVGANRIKLNASETLNVSMCDLGVLNDSNYITRGDCLYPYNKVYFMPNATGLYNFSVSVDPFDKQIEGNESNNNISKIINITKYANISIKLNNVLDFNGRDVHNVTVYDDTVISLNLTINNTGNYDANVFLVPVLDKQLNDPYVNITSNTTYMYHIVPFKFFVKANGSNTTLAGDWRSCIGNDYKFVGELSDDLVLPVSLTPYDINVSLYTYGNYPSFPYDNNSVAEYGGSIVFHVVPSPADLSLGVVGKYRHTMPYELSKYYCSIANEGELELPHIIAPGVLQVCSRIYNVGSKNASSTLHLYIDSWSNEVNNTTVFVPARSNIEECLTTHITARTEEYHIYMKVDPLPDEPNNKTNYAETTYTYEPANIDAKIVDISNEHIAENNETVYVAAKVKNNGDVDIPYPFNVVFAPSPYDAVTGIIPTNISSENKDINVTMRVVDSSSISEEDIYLPNKVYLYLYNPPAINSIIVPIFNAKYGDINYTIDVNASPELSVNVTSSSMYIEKNGYAYLNISVYTSNDSLANHIVDIKLNVNDSNGNYEEKHLYVYVNVANSSLPQANGTVVFNNNFLMFYNPAISNYKSDIVIPVFIQNGRNDTSITVSSHIDNGWLYADYHKVLHPYEYGIIEVHANFTKFFDGYINNTIVVNGLNANETKIIIGKIPFNRLSLINYSNTYLWFSNRVVSVDMFNDEHLKGMYIYVEANPDRSVGETDYNDNGDHDIVQSIYNLNVSIGGNITKGAWSNITINITNSGPKRIKLEAIELELWNDTNLINTYKYSYGNRNAWVGCNIRFNSYWTINPHNITTINDLIYIPNVSGNLKFKVKVYPMSTWFRTNEHPNVYANLGEKLYFNTSNITYFWKGNDTFKVLLHYYNNNDRALLINNKSVAHDMPDIFFDITNNLSYGENKFEVYNTSTPRWAILFYKNISFERNVSVNTCNELKVNILKPSIVFYGRNNKFVIQVENDCDGYYKLDGLTLEAYNGSLIHQFVVERLDKVLSPHEKVNYTYTVYVPASLPSSLIKARVFSVKEHDIKALPDINPFDTEYTNVVNRKAQAYNQASYISKEQLFNNSSSMLLTPPISSGTSFTFGLNGCPIGFVNALGILSNNKSYAFYKDEAYVEDPNKTFSILRAYVMGGDYSPGFLGRDDALGYNALKDIKHGLSKVLYYPVATHANEIIHPDIVEYKVAEANINRFAVPIHNITINVSHGNVYYGFTIPINITISNPYDADVYFDIISVEAYNGSAYVVLDALRNVIIPSNSTKSFSMDVLIPDDLDLSYNKIIVKAYERNSRDYYVMSNVGDKQFVGLFKYPYNGSLVIFSDTDTPISISAYEPKAFLNDVWVNVSINNDTVIQENRSVRTSSWPCGRFSSPRYTAYYPASLKQGVNYIKYNVGKWSWDVPIDAIRIKSYIVRESNPINIEQASKDDLVLSVNTTNTSFDGGSYVNIPIIIINNNDVNIPIEFLELDLIDSSNTYKYAYYSNLSFGIIHGVSLTPIIVPAHSSKIINFNIRLPKVGVSKDYKIKVKAYRFIDLGSIFKVSIKKLLSNANNINYDDSGWRISGEEDDSLHRRVIYTTKDAVSLLIKPFQALFDNNTEVYIDGTRLFSYDESALREFDQYWHASPLDNGKHVITFISTSNASSFNESFELGMIESISNEANITVNPSNANVLINADTPSLLSSPFDPVNISMSVNNSLGKDVVNYINVYLENKETNKSYLIASKAVGTPQGVSNVSLTAASLGNALIIGYGDNRPIRLYGNKFSLVSGNKKGYLSGIMDAVNDTAFYSSSYSPTMVELDYGSYNLSDIDSLVLLMPAYEICNGGSISFRVTLNSSIINAGNVQCGVSDTFVNNDSIIIVRTMAKFNKLNELSKYLGPGNPFENKPYYNMLYYVILRLDPSLINKIYHVKLDIGFNNALIAVPKKPCLYMDCGYVNMSLNNSVVIKSIRMQDEFNIPSRANILPLSSALSDSYFADYWAIENVSNYKNIYTQFYSDPKYYYRMEFTPFYDTSEIAIIRGSETWLNNNKLNQSDIIVSSFAPGQNNILLYKSNQGTPFVLPVQHYYTPVVVNLVKVYKYTIEPSEVNISLLRGDSYNVNFTITNIGTEPLNILLSLNESFASLSNGYVELSPGENKTIHVNIDSSSLNDGNYSILLQGDETHAGIENATINLQVSSIRVCGIQVNPHTVNFGSLIPGLISSETSISIKNIGNVKGNISVNATDWYSDNITWDVTATKRSLIKGSSYNDKEPLSNVLHIIGSYNANEQFNDYVQVIAPNITGNYQFKQNITYYIDCG